MLRVDYGISWQQAHDEVPVMEMDMLLAAAETRREQATEGEPKGPPTLPTGGDEAELPSALAAL